MTKARPLGIKYVSNVSYESHSLKKKAVAPAFSIRPFHPAHGSWSAYPHDLSVLEYAQGSRLSLLLPYSLIIPFIQWTILKHRMPRA